MSRVKSGIVLILVLGAARLITWMMSHTNAKQVPAQEPLDVVFVYDTIELEASNIKVDYASTPGEQEGIDARGATLLRQSQARDNATELPVSADLYTILGLEAPPNGKLDPPSARPRRVVRKWRETSRFKKPKRRHATSAGRSRRDQEELEAPKVSRGTFPRGGYWNLSCPFEWSRYSCVHHASAANDVAARQSLAFAWKEPRNAQLLQTAFGRVAKGDLNGRRVLLAGDSLTRQVFISMACLLSGLITDQRVEWIEWPCRGIPYW